MYRHVHGGIAVDRYRRQVQWLVIVTGFGYWPSATMSDDEHSNTRPRTAACLTRQQRLVVSVLFVDVFGAAALIPGARLDNTTVRVLMIAVIGGVCVWALVRAARDL